MVPIYAAQPEKTARQAWIVLGLLTLTVILSYADRVLLSAVAPLIQAEFGLSDTQLGLLAGPAFAVFYAVAGIPIGRIADRGDRSKVIALAVGVWSLMTAATALATNFVQLLLFRVGVGAGEAGGTPPSHSLLSDYFPPARRAFVLAIFHSGWAIGMALGLSVGAWIGELYGWRAAFVVVGLPGLLVAAIVAVFVPEPRRRNPLPAKPAGAWWRAQMVDAREIARNRPLVRLIIAAGVGNITFTAVTAWLPLFFVRSHGMSISAAGAFLGIVMGFGILPGLLTGGWLSDLLSKRDARLPMYGLSAAATACLLAFAVALWAPVQGVALVFTCLAVFAGTLTSAPLMAYVQNVSPPHLRATASALVMLTNAVLGGGVGPLMAGMLSDMFQPAFGTEALRWALTVSLAPHAVYACLLLTIPRLLPRRFEESAP